MTSGFIVNKTKALARSEGFCCGKAAIDWKRSSVHAFHAAAVAAARGGCGLGLGDFRDHGFGGEHEARSMRRSAAHIDKPAQRHHEFVPPCTGEALRVGAKQAILWFNRSEQAGEGRLRSSAPGFR